MNSLAYILLFVIIFGGISNCFISYQKRGLISDGSFVSKDWEYADLRVLDPLDAEKSNLDILAIYTRYDDCIFEVRVDLLNSTIDDDSAFILALDMTRGGNVALPMTHEDTDLEWDYLLFFEPGNNLIIFDVEFHVIPETQISIVVDRIYDYIELNLGNLLCSVYKQEIPIRLQVFMVESRSEASMYDVKDKSEVISSSQLPPPPLKVSFVYWNVFNVQTPADALRSWNGAHAGPMSSRHGMKTLIDSIQKYRYPVLICGLDTRMAWPVWDYMGVAGEVRGLVFNDLLGFEYCEFGDIVGNDGYANFIDINLAPTSASVKRKFVMGIYSLGVDKILVGGDYSSSFLGNPSVSNKILDYLFAHPWISIVRFHSPDQPKQKGLPDDQTQLRLEIQKLPENAVKSAALQMYNQLTTDYPHITPSFRKLKQSYLPYTRYYIPAAKWAADSRETNSCQDDWDLDGIPECVISTDTIFALIQLRGGYIPILFAKVDHEIHQIIGPSYQLATGLGDSSSWFKQQGVGADPGVFPGALFTDEYLAYVPYPIDGGIVLVRSDLAIRKTITIYPNSLNINISSAEVIDLQIPLILDPWRLSSSGWADAYRLVSKNGFWVWEIRNVVRASISSNHIVAVHSFLDSRDMLGLPEDPNYEYPPGHYLPIPLALIRLKTGENATINIDIGR